MDLLRGRANFMRVGYPYAVFWRQVRGRSLKRMRCTSTEPSRMRAGSLPFARRRNTGQLRAGPARSTTRNVPRAFHGDGPPSSSVVVVTAVVAVIVGAAGAAQVDRRTDRRMDAVLGINVAHDD